MISKTPSDEIAGIESRLRENEEERARLLARLNELRADPHLRNAPAQLLGRPVSSAVPTTSGEKIALFLKLFRCRESVFPKRWENAKKGTTGYSPACRNEWVREVCRKPNTKCAECNSQAFAPLDEAAIDAHLRGHATIGTYAIREDDACVFLACDFDGKGWHVDVECYRAIGEQLGIQVAVERSRSGNGAHAWIFFAEPVPARLARLLGTLILSRCGEVRHTIGLESYDRFFPNQDTLPRGGFGNLIALPLQRLPRESGNTLFIDANGMPYANLWAYLAGIRRLSLPEVRQTIQDYLPSRQELRNPDDDASEIADGNVFEVKAADSEIDLTDKVIEIVYGAQISVPLEELSSKLITRLKRTASFPNPEFYLLQRMRRPTYPHSRFIFSGEVRPDALILPRGVLEKISAILAKAGARVVLRDERLNRKGLKVEFSGALTDVQAAAVGALAKADTGILCAPPGAGKTVMACALIAKRRAPTLVLVHRQPLVVQWRGQLSKFLGIDKKEIGVLGGTKKRRTGKLDIVMLQSLTRMESVEELVQDYSQIIVDECHHIPATSFESVMKKFPARFVVGLTATPYRKDKLERILFQQCGQVRHEIKTADGGKLAKTVVFKETGFKLPEEAGTKPEYHVFAHHLTTDSKRNTLIANDAAAALSGGRFLLLISDRKDHLETLGRLICENAIVAGRELKLCKMDGELSTKARARALLEIEEARRAGIPSVILATASLIGEGFDLPSLDALILAMPLSFKGRMVQYAGRLHRLSEGKTNVVVYDYVDSASGMSLKMYRNRLKAYREMGYAIEEPRGLLGPRSVKQGNLFEGA